MKHCARIFPDPGAGAQETWGVGSLRAGGRFLVLEGSVSPSSCVGSKQAQGCLPCTPWSPTPSFRELCLGHGFPVGQRLLDVRVRCEALPGPGPDRAPFRLGALALSTAPLASSWPVWLSRARVFSRASSLGSVGAGPRAHSVPGLGLRFGVSPCSPLPRPVPAPLRSCEARGASGARSPAPSFL